MKTNDLLVGEFAAVVNKVQGVESATLLAALGLGNFAPFNSHHNREVTEGAPEETLLDIWDDVTGTGNQTLDGDKLVHVYLIYFFLFL